MSTVLGSSPYQNNQSSLAVSEQVKPWFNRGVEYCGECLHEHSRLFSRACANEARTASSRGLSNEHGAPVYLHHFSALRSAWKNPTLISYFVKSQQWRSQDWKLRNCPCEKPKFIMKGAHSRAIRNYITQGYQGTFHSTSAADRIQQNPATEDHSCGRLNTAKQMLPFETDPHISDTE